MPELVMATSEERIKILKMLEQGKLSADEASRLLKALTRGRAEQRRTSSEGQAKWLRIRVTEVAGKKTKVNVNLPIGLVNVGLRLGARFIPEEEGIDLHEISNALREALEAGVMGKIVDIADEEEGHRVEIYVE